MRTCAGALKRLFLLVQLLAQVAEVVCDLDGSAEHGVPGLGEGVEEDGEGEEEGYYSYD